MKLTKKQKKKYVKRNELKSAEEYIAAFQKKLAEMWAAIDKLPDGPRQEFIKNAGLEYEEIVRMMRSIVEEQIHGHIEKSGKAFWFIRGLCESGNVVIQDEFRVPDEIDKNEVMK